MASNSIPTRQKTGGAVAKTPGHKLTSTGRVHKPAHMGVTPNGGSERRGKGQK